MKSLQDENYEVRIHVRRRNKGRGLSSAVLLGFDKVTCNAPKAALEADSPPSQAKYETILCMDADLQHEPEAVPAVAGGFSSY